jgi:cytochrome c556
MQIKCSAGRRDAESLPVVRLLTLLLLAAALGGCASELALRGIMRDMGRDVAEIAEGLLREDYGAVERAANRLAAHPQPPAEERARIITWLGPRAARFRGHDAEANEHAKALAAAARQRQPAPVLDAFHKMQSACVGCHVEFRDALRKQFYPAL